MSVIATTIARQSVRLFVSAAVIHTALDVMEVAWKHVRKMKPVIQS